MVLTPRRNDAAGKKVGAPEEKIGASTEMRIAPPKTFASTCERDDAAAERVE
jgi:hypothetical protein